MKEQDIKVGDKYKWQEEIVEVAKPPTKGLVLVRRSNGSEIPVSTFLLSPHSILEDIVAKTSIKDNSYVSLIEITIQHGDRFSIHSIQGGDAKKWHEMIRELSIRADAEGENPDFHKLNWTKRSYPTGAVNRDYLNKK